METNAGPKVSKDELPNPNDSTASSWGWAADLEKVAAHDE